MNAKQERASRPVHLSEVNFGIRNGACGGSDPTGPQIYRYVNTFGPICMELSKEAKQLATGQFF